MALGRAAKADVRALMLHCGVFCSSGCRRQAVLVLRLDQHATVVLKSKACYVLAQPVVCSLCQPHTRAAQARAPSVACPGPRVCNCPVLWYAQPLRPSSWLHVAAQQRNRHESTK